jgi:hypothetical protein
MGGSNWNGLVQGPSSVHSRAARSCARKAHRRLEDVFEDALGVKRERERRLDLLFCATDFYVWKLLRRDLGKSRTETVNRMLETVNALLRSFTAEPGEGRS